MDENESVSGQEPEQTEKQILMSRARTLGITFSNAISTEKLREKIDAKLAGEAEPEDDTSDENEDDAEDEVFTEAAPAPEPIAARNPLAEGAASISTPAAPIAPTPAPVPEVEKARPLTKAEKEAQLRNELQADAMRLVRLRITNMNPAKKDLPGEIFTVANKYIGTVRKFVPYGEATDNGYHVPYCIYTMLQEKKFLNITTVKARQGGTPQPRTTYAREFALEILDPLTPAELRDLAQAQIAAGSVDNNSGEQ